MSKDFILPDIGEGIVECEVVEWLVEEGDFVEEDQPVCDVMTDKALVQIPAISDGIITKLYYQKGDIAKVHEPLFSLSSKTESQQEQTPSQGVTEQVMDHRPVTSTEDIGSIEDFLLPDIGEGIVECEVVEWLVKEGDNIKEDQAICDVMTDKALVQIPAKSDGVIEKLYYQKGEIAQVHQPLFSVRLTQTAAKAPVQAPTSNVVELKADKATKNEVVQQPVEDVVMNHGKKAVASPAVRRLAREMGVDIRVVTGSGEKGRVYKEDLVAYQQQGSVQVSSIVESAPAMADSQINNVVPIKGVQSAMAKAMQESVSTIPHFTYSDDVDVTDLVNTRVLLKESFAKQDIKLTLMPFFVKALSLALKQFPILNTQVDEECTELTYITDHNIGIAVDSKVGLLVPNVKQCQNKSVRELAIQLNELTDNARAGRLAPEHLKQGTITISNIGAIGGTTATPIINKPEVAIVALGKIVKQPKFDQDGNVVARQMMTVNWSADHRIIDGATMARFNNLWTSYLQNPSSMLVELQ